MSDKPKPQPQEPKPIQPAKPSENPGTPIQKGPLPIKPVQPSQSPGTGIPFNEPKNNKIFKGNN